MIIAVLVVLGLCFGSFANALVWRVRQQETGSKSKRLSVLNGRSMCPACKHELAAGDLVPVLSWLALRGKCRYCGRPISVQYPLVELVTAAAFVLSYLWWPARLTDSFQIAVFGLWLAILTGLLALLVYDLRWNMLPDRIVFPLTGLAIIQAVIAVISAGSPVKALVNEILAVAVGGGIFYFVFQASKGKWIGGGDVKLGWLLGLVVGTPARAFLLIFLAAATGSLISLPLVAAGRLKRTSTIPFGPFLIAGAFITELFGAAILSWYWRTFIGFR